MAGRESAVSHEPPAISHEPPAISHEPPAISHEPLAISHEPPAISHEPPAISHEPPAISHEPPAISHEPVADIRRYDWFAYRRRTLRANGRIGRQYGPGPLSRNLRQKVVCKPIIAPQLSNTHWQ